MSINRVNISGNLTREPELRATQGGTQILTFGVAVNDCRKNPQTGQWEDVPNFVDCVLFGNRAESVSKFIGKGSKVAIEGKLRYSQWEKDGGRRSKLEALRPRIRRSVSSRPTIPTDSRTGLIRPLSSLRAAILRHRRETCMTRTSPFDAVALVESVFGEVMVTRGPLD